MVGEYGSAFNLDHHAIQRAYPRRIQGRMASFYYNAVALDAADWAINWAALRPEELGELHLGDRRFALV